MNRVAVLLVMAATGCGSASATPPASPHSVPAEAEPVVEEAMALRSRGDYLRSGWALEAALQRGADEETCLFLLVDSQIRSGRLLAALFTLERLCFLYPEHESARGLYRLIADTIGTVRPTEVCP